jgi:hypothetical protein
MGLAIYIYKWSNPYLLIYLDVILSFLPEREKTELIFGKSECYDQSPKILKEAADNIFSLL